MGQDHGHDHTHGANKKTLVISFIIITLYMIVEVIGGIFTNSLALLADAGHMLSDGISLAIALLAFKFGEKQANYRKTYGFIRFEILAAFLNGVTLILVAVYIFYEAIKRFQEPPEISSSSMLVIATVGLLINLLVASIMLRGGDVKENLNMRGAYLHVISDILGSVGAIIAALLIMFFNLSWADSLASVIVAALVLRSGYFVTKAAIHVLMEGTPQHVDMEKVVGIFQYSKGVVSVFDLHVWSITSGLNALSCHVVVDGRLTVYESEHILENIEHALKHQNIQHVTIQLKTTGDQCVNSVLCNRLLIESSGHHHHHHTD